MWSGRHVLKSKFTFFHASEIMCHLKQMYSSTVRKHYEIEMEYLAEQSKNHEFVSLLIPLSFIRVIKQQSEIKTHLTIFKVLYSHLDSEKYFSG